MIQQLILRLQYIGGASGNAYRLLKNTCVSVQRSSCAPYTFHCLRSNKHHTLNFNKKVHPSAQQVKKQEGKKLLWENVPLAPTELPDCGSGPNRGLLHVDGRGAIHKPTAGRGEQPLPIWNVILSFYLPSMLPSKLPSIKTAFLLCTYFQPLPPPPSDSNSSSSSSPTPTTPPPPFSPIYPVRVKMLVDSPTVVYIDDSFAHITVEYTSIASVVSANTVSFCGNIFLFNCGQEKSSKDLAASR